MVSSGAASRPCRIMILCPNPARIRRFVLNAPLSSVIWPLTIRCRLGDYTRAMMIKRILTVLATVAAGTAGTSLALAQVYPQAPGSTYSRDPNYPPGGYPADYRDARDAAPDFDALEDD